MKKQSKNQNYEIDLFNYIKKFWKIKFYIFWINLISILLVVAYGYSLPKQFTSSILLKGPNYQPVDSHEIVFDNINLESDVNFFINFNYLLRSQNNFSTFINDNKYLKTKESMVRFGESKRKDMFSIIFSEDIDGQNFLTNYVKFVGEKARLEIIKRIKSEGKKEISRYRTSLDIAKKIELEKPFTFLDNNLSTKQSESTFYLGSKVLEMIIEQKKLYISNIDNLKFDYNPVINYPSPNALINKSISYYFLIGLFLGVLLSFLVGSIFAISKVKE